MKKTITIIAGLLLFTGCAESPQEETTNTKEVKEETVAKDTTSKVKLTEEEQEERQLKEEREKDKEYEYLRFIEKTSDKYIENFIIYAKQTQSSSYSNEWIEVTASALSGIADTNTEVISYNTDDVPDKFIDGHYYYMLAAETFDEAIDLFIEGYDNIDSYLIERSAEKFTEANEYIGIATSEIAENVEG